MECGTTEWFAVWLAVPCLGCSYKAKWQLAKGKKRVS